MQPHHHDQERLTRLLLRGTDHRIEILDQKEHTERIAESHQHIIQRGKRTPAQYRDGDPDQIRVAIERPALDQFDALGPEPLQYRPEAGRHEDGVSVDQPRRAGEELKVILEMALVLSGEVLAYGAR